MSTPVDAELDLLAERFLLDQQQAERLLRETVEKTWPMFRPDRRDARRPRGPRSRLKGGST